MMNQIKKMENGTFQATFADGTTKLYKELIAVDFDGETNASYNNSQLGIVVDGITLNAAVDAASQAAILDKLNAGAAEGVLYINAADAAELPKTSYSTIYVGDTDAFAAYGNFAGIAETTGDFAASTKGDNAFVLTGAEFSADALADTIAHEAGHLMGTVEHDYGMDGITLDDFEATYTGLHIIITANTTYNGDTFSNMYAPQEGNTNGGAFQVDSGMLTLENVTIDSCHAAYHASYPGQNGWGGAISVNRSTSFANNEGLVIRNSLIQNCYSGRAGGAINISNGRTDGTALVAVYGSTFSNNSATNNSISNLHPYGGAIFAHGASVHFTVDGSLFYNNHATQGSGAIAMVSATAEITGSTFTGNDGAIALNTSFISATKTPTLALTNCAFTTKSDTIAVTNGTLTLSGTNMFAANVTKGSSATVTGSANAGYTFTSNSEITSFQVALGANSTMTFNNVTSGKIALNGLTNNVVERVTTTNVNTTSTKIGDITQVASNVGWLSAGTSQINLNGHATTVTGSTSSEAYMNGNALFVGYRFSGRAADSTDTTLNFVESHYEEDFGTVTLGCGKTVTGNAATGAASTELNGKIYADSNSLKMNNLSYTGIIYGGNTYTSTETVSNAIDLAFSNMTFADGNTNRIYGGGYVSGGDVTLSNGATVTMSDVTLGKDMSIYGGGVLAAGSLNTGNIALTLGTTASSAGQSGNVYAGVYDNTAATGSTIDLGTVSTTITSGSYNLVGNGSRITNASSTQGTSSLTISGGTFASYVYGGAFNYGSNATAIVNGDVNFTISGGTFNELVFGGCAAKSSDNAANTTITGNVNLTINATSNIVFNKTVYAGSEGNGQITGNVNVTFKGDASKITWSSKSIAISGGNQYTTGKISGRILNFGDAENGFSGNFSGKIQNRFDSMVLTNNSDITFTSKTILDSISNWTIGADCSLKWTDSNGSCDFAGDTLNITDAVLEAGTYDLFDLGSAGSLTGWGDGMTVKFGGTDATATAPGVYTGTLGGLSCTLSQQENKIQLVIA